MKKVLVFAALLGLSACASGPRPGYYAGQYYMGGDASCKSVRSLSSTQVMCLDKHGNETGYRDAMTPAQMQMWGYQQAFHQAQMEQLNQSIQGVGQAFANAGNQISQTAQSYNPPQVQPIARSAGVTYRQAGESMLQGSNGVYYRLVGNSVLGSDGTTCQIVGSLIMCR